MKIYTGGLKLNRFQYWWNAFVRKRVYTCTCQKCWRRGIVHATLLQPHQARVVAEKEELDEKAKKLSDFIGNSPASCGHDFDAEEGS